MLAQAAYLAWFVGQTSFVVAGHRYFCLFDDAMISMRFARNLANGFGLVWNPGGEPVEGITNPLWTLLMAGFHLFPFEGRLMSLWVQVSSCAFLLGTTWLVHSIAKRLSSDDHSVAPALAATLSAFYLPLNNWAAQGMEVGALAFLVCLAVHLTLMGSTSGRFSWWPYVVLGTALLVRMDAIVPMLVVWGYLLLTDSDRRKGHVVAGMACLVTTLGMPTLLRFLYYGDVLPNTYYLKLRGFPFALRVERGATVLLDFLVRLNPLTVILAAVGSRSIGRNPSILVGGIVASQCAYSVYVGGDAWEWWGGSNRYISPVMPLFFILTMLGVEAIVRRMAQQHRTRAVLSVFATAAILLCVNMLRGPESLRVLALVEPPLHVVANNFMVARAELVTRITRPTAHVAVVWAGILPYFSDRVAVDLLGKSDRRIARMDVRKPGLVAKDFYPGHTKWDYDYSIDELRPDVIVDTWGPFEAVAPHLEGHYRQFRFGFFNLYLLAASDAIDWRAVEAAGGHEVLPISGI